MKKLTMTRVLAPLAALAFTLGAQAADYAKDDFEGTWTNASGGYEFVAGPDQAADATEQYTYDGDAPSAAISPIGGATNLKGLKLSTEDGILFRNLTGANIGDGGLYVDTDVQFTITDASDRPTPVTEGTDTDKFIIWLEADDVGNTNLCVWAREYTLENGDFAVSSNKVYKLNSSAIVPGSWHRLTVKAIAQVSTNDTVKIPGFQVYLDSTLLSSDDAMFDNDNYTACWSLLPPESQSLADAGTFFPAMSGSLGTLAKVGFSGEGKIDDFVVSDNIPSSLPRVAVEVTFPSAVACATLMGVDYTSSPAFLTLEPGQSFSFSMADLKDANLAPLTSYSFKLDEGGLGDDWAIVGNIDGAYDDTEGAVTITAGNASAETASFTIALERSSSAKLTLDLSRIDGYLDKIDTISYTVGGVTTTISNSQLEDQVYIEGLELDNVVTLAVTLQSGVSGMPVFTVDSGATASGSNFTITDNSAAIFITIATPVATVDGVSYATFAEAFAAAKTAGEPVMLCDDVELEAAQAVAAGETVTIDLNGNTITGADGAAAFANAGTLTITDSSQNHDGGVTAGTGEGSYVVANTGALSLEYGAYAGAFTNSGTFTITTDCGFDNDLDGAYEAEDGYEILETALGSGTYKLTLLEYTITYMNGQNQLTGLTPATYTVTNNVTLPTEVDLGVVGSRFTGWKDGSDADVASWEAGDKTGNLTLYAQTEAVVAEEWTITYMYGDTELEGLTPSNYTASAVVTLPTEVNLGVVGVTFDTWTNAEGTVVTGWPAGGLTGNQIFYAKTSALVPPAGTEPGAAVSGSPFATQAEAESAASSATVAVPAAVAAELTPEQQNAYKILFHAKVGEPVDGKYPVTMELTGDGAATIQSSADTAVAALAAKLTAAATAQQTVEVAAQPGFYYSIESGTDLSNLAEPQQRTLATGNTVELTMPTLGTKGFYRVKVSYEQLPPAPNN